MSRYRKRVGVGRWENSRYRGAGGNRRTPKKTPMIMPPTAAGERPWPWWWTTMTEEGLVVTIGMNVVVGGVTIMGVGYQEDVVVVSQSQSQSVVVV